MSAQEALFAPSPTTTPTSEKKPVERTEKQKTVFVQDRLIPKDELKELEKKFSEGNELERAFGALDSAPIRPIPPEEHIARTYDIAPNCTNVPRLLYAILCEVVRGRV